MDEIARHASEHGYRIEEAVLNGNAGYRLCGGHRVFGERVRIFRATPDKRSMSRVRRDLFDEARRLIEQHGSIRWQFPGLAKAVMHSVGS